VSRGGPGGAPPRLHAALGEVLDWAILAATVALLGWAVFGGLTFMPSAGFLEHRVPLLAFERAALAIGGVSVFRRLLGGRALPGAPLWGLAAAATLGILSLAHTTFLYGSREEIFFHTSLLVLVLAALMALNDRVKTHVFLGGLVAIALGEAVIGLGQYVSGVPTPAYWLSRSFAELIRTRAYGTLASPNLLAAFLVLGIAGTAVLTVSLPWAWRPLPAAALAAEVLGLIVTYSRGGYVGLGVFIVVAAVLFWPVRRRAWPVLLLIVLVAGLAVVRLPSVGARAQSIAPDQEDTGTSRLYIWHTALAMWRAHPTWGTGLGTFNAVYSAYRVPDVLETYAMINVPGSAHDDYLQVLVTTGKVGSGLLALVVLWGIWRGTRRYVRGGVQERAWLAGWAAGMAGLATVSIVDESLFVVTNLALLLLLAAVVAAHTSLVDRPAVRLWQRLFVLPLIAVVLCLPPLLAPPVEATSLHDEAVQQVKTGEFIEAVRTFETAMAADPLDGVTPAYFGDLLADLYVRRLDNPMGPWGTMRDRATELYLYASRLSPWDAYPRAELGRLEHAEKHEAAAAAALEDAVRLDPYTARYRLWLAEADLAAGDRDRATAQLGEAVRLYDVELLTIEHHDGRGARYDASAAQLAEAERLLTLISTGH